MTSPRIKRDNEWSSKKIGLWTKKTYISFIERLLTFDVDLVCSVQAQVLA